MNTASASVGPYYQDRPQPRAVIAWLGMHPDVRNQPEIINSMFDDLIELLAPHGVLSAYSAEPRTYRLNQRGRRLLAEAFSVGRISQLGFLALDPNSALYPNMEIRANAEVLLGMPRIPEVAATISLRIQPETDDSISAVVSQATGFVRKWFGPLQAISAFVSPQGKWDERAFDDTTGITVLERNRPFRLVDWTDQRHFLRGVFWGNGLGPDLCDRLGGQDHVLRHAPVFCAEPLGAGVWLQISEPFPPPQEAIDRLAAFLAPLLTWTKDDLIPRHTPYPTDLASQEPITERDEFADDTSNPMVPMKWLDTIDGLDIGINIYLEKPPTPEQEDAIKASLDRWYTVGFNGGFGGAGFHSISQPSVDRASLRCMLDLGSADAPLAFDSLRKRLAALSNVQVHELILGTEIVE